MPSQETPEARLESALAEYLKAVDLGERVDRQAMVDRHPELREELLSFFRNQDAFDRLAEPIREAALGPDEATLDDRAGGTSAGGRPLVRYFGDYEILAEIARGGMGVVYRAQQVSLGRIVALKMILAGELAAPEALARFRQEAQDAANLDHPHIVPIYEVGEHQGQHYFTMKLIEGGSLATRIGTPGKPATPQRTAASLIGTIARAVHHAHQRGVLHRDLKPGNILLDADGQPHVSDFGLAKRIETAAAPSASARAAQPLTLVGAVVGTPGYMSPEQARATAELTTAADVYSLGALLYALLTGRPPHEGKSPSETLVLALAGEPARPSPGYPPVGRDLETICLKCLDRDPGRRYDSAAALADELERWLRGEPLLARPASAWERSAKWARRRRRCCW
jgi:serine/threonine protein kinase